MPELPEVETSRRILENALVGKRINLVEVADDSIVLKNQPASAISSILEGGLVTSAGRKGKFWWLEVEGRGAVLGHLGMSGALADLTPNDVRMVNYQNVKVDPDAHRPRFLKLWIESEEGRKIAMVDGRRLSRLWTAKDVQADTQVAALGPDAFTDLPLEDEFASKFNKRKAPIKALLLNQAIVSGIGNYLADEILYRAEIAPARLGSQISSDEYGRLRRAVEEIVGVAVNAEADFERFPKEWLFHVRWGGGRGEEFHLGQPLVRETIGGRTTAWVPSKQK